MQLVSKHVVSLQHVRRSLAKRCCRFLGDLIAALPAKFRNKYAQVSLELVALSFHCLAVLAVYSVEQRLDVHLAGYAEPAGMLGATRRRCLLP